ncbi:MAG TPA: hypothetical protein PKC24_07070 [Cyclobacteriaceae bacterium]|nr:hypothetical protein [Cyclobacteriaceae bacterium]
MQHAAIYTTDRTLLKELLLAKLVVEQADGISVSKPKSEKEKPLSFKPVQGLNIDEEVAKLSPAALRKDLKKNLERLARLKKQFEKEFPQAIVVDLPSPKPESTKGIKKKILEKNKFDNELIVSAPLEIAEKEKKKPVKKVAAKKSAPKKTTAKKKAAKKSAPKKTAAKKSSASDSIESKVIEAKKASVNPPNPQEIKAVLDIPVTKTLQKKARIKPSSRSAVPEKTEDTEALIASIKSSKKEIVPENNKQKEQIRIIDNFIKAQPNIASRKKMASEEIIEESDLAANSVEFGDSIISETLADILIQQGKKDKAIEVLKRLIWKFPQKKTYFAAQIEELKK